MKRALLVIAAISVACTDPVSAPRSTSDQEPTFAKLTTAKVFERYVAMGTSNSMGVQSAGVFASGQQAAWPALLATRARPICCRHLRPTLLLSLRSQHLAPVTTL